MLVVQIIIKQWDKSQRTPQHIEERANRPNHYPITFPPAVYVLDDQCVIDQRGDDLQGNRLSYSKPDSDTLQFDRFRVNLNNKLLDYVASSDKNSSAMTIGSIDNKWIQCKYDWRYGVDEGGFYYWLYEEVTVNVIYLNSLNKDVFMQNNPDNVVML